MYRSRNPDTLRRIFLQMIPRQVGFGDMYIFDCFYVRTFRDTCMNARRTFLNVELRSGCSLPHGSRHVPMLQIQVIQIEVVGGEQTRIKRTVRVSQTRVSTRRIVLTELTRVAYTRSKNEITACNSFVFTITPNFHCTSRSRTRYHTRSKQRKLRHTGEGRLHV